MNTPDQSQFQTMSAQATAFSSNYLPEPNQFGVQNLGDGHHNVQSGLCEPTYQNGNFPQMLASAATSTTAMKQPPESANASMVRHQFSENYHGGQSSVPSSTVFSNNEIACTQFLNGVSPTSTQHVSQEQMPPSSMMMMMNDAPRDVHSSDNNNFVAPSFMGAPSMMPPGRAVMHQSQPGPLLSNSQMGQMVPPMPSYQMGPQVPGSRMENSMASYQIAPPISGSQMGPPMPSYQMGPQVPGSRMENSMASYQIAPPISGSQMGPPMPSYQMGPQVPGSRMENSMASYQIAPPISGSQMGPPMPSYQMGPQVPGSRMENSMASYQIAPPISGSQMGPPMPSYQMGSQVPGSRMENSMASYQIAPPISGSQMGPPMPSYQMGSQVPGSRMENSMASHQIAPPISGSQMPSYQLGPSIPCSQMSSPISVSQMGPQMPSSQLGPQMGTPISVSQMGPQMPSSQLGPPIRGSQMCPPISVSQMGPQMPSSQLGPQMGTPISVSQMPSSQLGPPIRGSQMGPPISVSQMGPPMQCSQVGPPIPGSQMASFQMGPPIPGSQMANSQMGPPMVHDMMGPAGPGMQQQKSRLDPNLVPSVVQVVEEDRSTRSGPFPTGYPTAEYPPLTSTDFAAQDQGNCNPKFMRSSLYVAPASPDLLKASRLPFVVAITPFAPLRDDEYHPPIIDLGDAGPARCQRCKAYMCSFMGFQDGGRRFHCPFCLSSTPVEDSYFAHLDHTGRRTDIQNRPEQFLGSYDFVAPKPYCKNGVKPKEPAYVFMLEVTYPAIQSGLVSTFCRNIQNLLCNLPKEMGQERSTIKVAFATYDHTIHFYNLKSVSGHPEMLIVNDVNDVFVPFVDGFFVNVDEASESISILLVEIEKMFASTRIPESMIGPVIQSGLDALKCSDRSGKLFIIHTNLPSFDAPGKLKNRDDRKILGTDKEKIVLQPENDFYVKLGEECVKNGCAVDLFLFPNAYVDVASLAPVCSITGGTLNKYQYFEGSKDGPRFIADLSHSTSVETVFDTMMRVRTSTGLRPTVFHGSFFMDNSTDMEMGALDSDKAVHAEIRHDDKLPAGAAYIQAAILYTSCSGQRRLRIHNMALPVSSEFSQLYRLTDPDCLISYLFKQAEFLVREKSPKDVREIILTQCAQMLATYREKCSEQSPAGQLILPESLKLLPLYASCIVKNDAVSGGNDLTVDDRAWMMHIIRSLRINDTLSLLYPSVFAVSNIALEKPVDEIVLRDQVRSSYDQLSHDKAYIINNGLMMFLWIGLQVPQQWVQDVFNSSSVNMMNVENHNVPERDNPSSRGLRKVIEQLNKGRARRMKIYIIRQQDALESWMKKYLVEDRSSTMPSYIDHLCNIHREIRSLLNRN